jgi:hypothetical protein
MNALERLAFERDTRPYVTLHARVPCEPQSELRALDMATRVSASRRVKVGVATAEDSPPVQHTPTRTRKLLQRASLDAPSPVAIAGAASPRYAPQTALVGAATQRALGEGRWLVAGLGAVGCEVVKNLALMGVGAHSSGSSGGGGRGGVTVVDDTSVQPCNPLRQCLFRCLDVGRSMPEAAVDAARRIDRDASFAAVVAAPGGQPPCAALGAELFESLHGAHPMVVHHHRET